MNVAQRTSEILFQTEGHALAAIRYPPTTSAVNKQSRSNIAVDKVGDGLRQIVAKYPEIYNQSDQCTALLRDFCPGHNREIFILTAALKSGIVADLLSYNNSVLGNVQKDNLVDRLQSECGFSDKDARWAVKTWDMALQKTGPEIQDLQENDFQSTEKIDDSLKSTEPTTHNSPSLPTDGLSAVAEVEPVKHDKDHDVHSYSPSLSKASSSWKKILIIVPVAIVGVVIGFGMLAGPWNPGGSDNNDNAVGGGEVSITSAPTQVPEPEPAQVPEPEPAQVPEPEPAQVPATIPDWPIILEWEVI